MIEAAWQRAMLLYQQQRWDLAERELRLVLTQNPEFAPAYAMLGIILSRSGSLDEALAESRQAITIDPENAFGYRAVAIVCVERRELDAAANAIATAIQLAPEDTDHRGMLAMIRFRQERWHDAVRAADAGLAIDPQDTDCLNLRSLALTKLGRGKEATASVEASLAHDPDNPYTHQAIGFARLHQGDAKQALLHFKEALRRDPTLDGARQGLVEALKARNPIYRTVLGWFLWLERFEPERRTQILVGIWIATMVLRNLLAKAGYENAALVAGYSWLGFVLLTACAVPIFNLLLLLHPIGRHALARSSRNHALILGSVLLITVSIWAGSLLSDMQWMRGSRLFWLIYLLPIAGLGIFYSGWAMRVMQAVCIALFGAFLWWLFDITGLVAEQDLLFATPESLEKTAQVALWQTNAQAAFAFIDYMTWTAALSTWFVMLAPKGHQIRRR